MPWLAIVCALGIAVATLYPTSVTSESPKGLCLICGDRGLADFLLNVGLFTPLGLAFAWHRWPFARTVLVSAALTLAIEASQIRAVPGRDASAGDLVSNIVGAALGWMLLRILLRRRRGAVSRWGLHLAAPAAAALLAGSVALLQPDPPDSRYFTQWTAAFANMERYRGRVLSSAIGDVALSGPPWAIAKAADVRAGLSASAPIALTIEAGPAPRRLAPIFSIYDEHRTEVILIGAEDNDVVLRQRVRAAAVRLDAPALRFPRVLDDVAAGDTARLHIEAGSRASCASAVTRSGNRSVCATLPSAGDGWQLLYARVLGRGRTVAGVAWLLMIGAGVGLLAGATSLPAAVVSAAVLWLGPALFGVALTPLVLVVAFVAGLFAGPIALRLLPLDRAA